MLAKIKKQIKDDLLLAAIIGGLLLVAALVVGGILFELLKVVAVIKYVFS